MAGAQVTEQQVHTKQGETLQFSSTVLSPGSRCRWHPDCFSRWHLVVAIKDIGLLPCFLTAMERMGIAMEYAIQGQRSNCKSTSTTALVKSTNTLTTHCSCIICKGMLHVRMAGVLCVLVTGIWITTLKAKCSMIDFSCAAMKRKLRDSKKAPRGRNTKRTGIAQLHTNTPTIKLVGT